VYYLSHVIDDDGSVFGGWVLQQVFEESGLAGAEEATQNSDRNSGFGFLSERLVSRCCARLNLCGLRGDHQGLSAFGRHKRRAFSARFLQTLARAFNPAQLIIARQLIAASINSTMRYLTTVSLTLRQ
jgi:hypothetical protein